MRELFELAIKIANLIDAVVAVYAAVKKMISHFS